MSSIKSLLSVLVSSVLVAGCATGAKEKEWITLFDGKSTESLRGFRMAGFPNKCWKVENGTLWGVATPGEVTDVITREQFTDFELVCEWRISNGGNSGIMYRVSEEKSTPWQTGPEYQLLDDSKHKDGQNPKTSTGALYAMKPANASKQVKPVGEWNSTRIVFKNNHVEHWLNGSKVVEYDWGSPELKQLISESKFKSMPLFATKDTGYISFQHHHNDVWFRNIKIRRL